ncbi:diguanylate phosphodiesterase [Phytobacter sp. RSE-02]|uniref:diguanylate phosphodiesterase n=1 Tax=Phytobacter sp. RSE-02 TaxID=3229229 RepID=UPI00339D9C9A
MLTTLIYQSKSSQNDIEFDLNNLIHNANIKNQSLRLTGVLIYNGEDFFQVIEGDEFEVDYIFNKIRADQRHQDIVELMRDYSPKRYFDNYGIRLIDLRDKLNNHLGALDLLNKGEHWNISVNKRVYYFINNFITRGRQGKLQPNFYPSNWVMKKNASQERIVNFFGAHEKDYSFALQAIVDPFSRRISSFEALIRDNKNHSPAEIFSSMSDEEMYKFDLESKLVALKLAEKLLKPYERISINLLPGSLVHNCNSVDFIIKAIHECNLEPYQVTIEIIENDLILDLDAFIGILKSIRAAGIGLAIDDFGAGYSRFNLLSRLQPDKLKLDRELIKNIHVSGPKQAIVSSLIKFSQDMGISLVAEGIEKIDEWCWLQSSGIDLFQGFLFSRPCLNGVGEIFWPAKKLT